MTECTNSIAPEPHIVTALHRGMHGPIMRTLTRPAETWQQKVSRVYVSWWLARAARYSHQDQ